VGTTPANVAFLGVARRDQGAPARGRRVRAGMTVAGLDWSRATLVYVMSCFGLWTMGDGARSGCSQEGSCGKARSRGLD